MKTYTCVYLGAMMLAIVSTPIVIRIARHLNIVDAPGIRKVHSRPIPCIGGLAIFFSMIGIIIPVWFLPNFAGDSFRRVGPEILVVLCSAGLMFLVGLIDDIRGLRVRAKLLAQIAAAIVVCAAGIRIESIAITDRLSLGLSWFSWPFTLLWIVGITNAVNLSDGLDGLAAGVSAITCGVIAVLGVHNGDAVMAVLMLALLGSLTGFLLFNFDPARIFMGGSGSQFLGFILASSSIVCATKTETIVGLALPTLALGIPIFDTLFSMLRRFLERRSMFAPDRSHFHHKLLALGLRQRHAVITAYVITLLAAGLGMFMLFTRNAETIIIFVAILLLLVLLFRVVGLVKMRETISALRHKFNMSNQKRQEIEQFQNIELHFRQARIFEQWWQAVCFAADKMDFHSSSLPLVIQPAAGDAGGAIGAAFHVWNQLLAKPRSFVLTSPYLGPGCSNAEIKQELDRNSAKLRELGCTFRETEGGRELCRKTAGEIADGKVVGWFQGRLEWGPRALGNRSIVCDPRRSDIRDLLNAKIKRRESFRPFAPSIHLEATGEYFETDSPDPFMSRVFRIRPEKRSIIPAVTHVDGTGRLQTVRRQDNPLYWELIEQFRLITGVPVVLNTSFNENEPIVCLPAEALDCFMRTKMDMLVLGDFVVERK